MQATTDFLVIGGGIAGASAAYELAAHGSVRLLERESMPGTHTTGRSAAFLVGSYGTEVVQRLTEASRGFLEAPPEGFCETPLVSPRPSLTIARADQAQRLADAIKLAREAGAEVEEIDAAGAATLFPVLRPGYAVAGMLEPRSKSIDVAALLAAYLRGFRGRGGLLVSGADVDVLRPVAGSWQVRCGASVYEAGVVVNAAGAWGDAVAGLAGCPPIGLQPLRRTAVVFDPPADREVGGWPCVLDADEDFYLKPSGAQLLASPCDEEPSAPCDAAPDELAVALAVDRIERATTLRVRHLVRSWAGLRSFVADRSPVVGMDPARPGFFWLVGQGGFGIMTSPAMARAVAALIVSKSLPPELVRAGLRAEDLSPERVGLSRRPGGRA